MLTILAEFRSVAEMRFESTMKFRNVNARRLSRRDKARLDSSDTVALHRYYQQLETTKKGWHLKGRMDGIASSHLLRTGAPRTGLATTLVVTASVLV